MNVYLNEFSVFIFDLDGCVYRNFSLYPGAKELINGLLNDDKKIYFLTNNSRDTSETIRKKLNEMGLNTDKIPIITMTEMIGKYLYEKNGASKILSVGSEELSAALQKEGHQLLTFDSEEICDFVVVGRDTEFTYEKLYTSTRFLTGKTKLVLVNPDFNHPGQEGENVPETGAIAAAIQAAAEITEISFVGKPNSYAYERILNEADVDVNQCVMIGDNPLTDIQGGASANMKTIWISHSKKFPQNLGIQPDITVHSMQELYEMYIANYFYYVEGVNKKGRVIP
ncbi:HAD-IIA family hydrolase [Bacillus gobiensis]|uniref:HAD-IIA family hydrolase n=1 Tax=Bacillus gobiensis TaxID=1441095 RepID=UPI003D1F336D